MPTIASPIAGGVGLVLLAAGAGVFAKGVQLLVSAGSFVRSDTVDVLEAGNAEGPIDTVGAARSYEETLSSPLDAVDCLVYEYESKRRLGDDTYRIVESGQRGVPFLLEDETGSILVDPTDASLELATGVTIGAPQGGAERVDAAESEEPAWEFEERYRTDHGTGLASDLGFTENKHPSHERYEEFRLDVGETVHVRGTVDTGESGARTGGAVSGVVRGTEQDDLLISDTTKRRAILRMLFGTVVLTLVSVALVGGGYLVATIGF